MRVTSTALSVAGAMLLGGSVALGGMGHGGNLGAHAGHEGARLVPVPLHRAEASSSGLTIALSYPRPSSGVAVAIDARLRGDGTPHELNDATVWLRIEAPDGSVEELPMPPLSASATGTHRVQYVFPSAGVHLLTAEGQVGMGAAARTVSVTTATDVGREASAIDHRHWHAPAALLGGLGMVAMMALMMAGSGS